jgi:hypothetical protein
MPRLKTIKANTLRVARCVSVADVMPGMWSGGRRELRVRAAYWWAVRGLPVWRVARAYATAASTIRGFVLANGPCH